MTPVLTTPARSGITIYNTSCEEKMHYSGTPIEILLLQSLDCFGLPFKVRSFERCVHRQNRAKTSAKRNARCAKTLGLPSTGFRRLKQFKRSHSAIQLA
jgi:hypothetical protein